MASHEEFLLDRIVPWAEANPNLRAIAEMGSRTHDAPADDWADMDLLLLVSDTAAITDSDEWLAGIGPHWVALRHPGPFPDLPVRQVLFEGGLDFDIVAMKAGHLAEMATDPGVAFAIASGFRLILDKDGELAALELPGPVPPFSASDISREDFDFVVGDFLFQTVWASKHLRRGELFAAKDDVDCYMKGDLVRMMEWHAVATRPGTVTRSGGRHLEVWAEPKLVGRLAPTFAGYDAASVAGALLELIELFGDVATETGALLGFDYPHQNHEMVSLWVRDCLAVYDNP